MSWKTIKETAFWGSVYLGTCIPLALIFYGFVWEHTWVMVFGVILLVILMAG